MTSAKKALTFYPTYDVNHKKTETQNFQIKKKI